MYLAEMNFVEDHLIRMSNTPEPRYKRQQRYYTKRNFIIPFTCDCPLDWHWHFLQESIALAIPALIGGRIRLLVLLAGSLSDLRGGHDSCAGYL